MFWTSANYLCYLTTTPTVAKFIYLLSPWFYDCPKTLASLITDTQSCLLSSFLNFNLPHILLHIFQLSHSRSSPSSTSLRLTVQYFLICPILIRSYYMSSPFQSNLFLLICATVSRSLYNSLSSWLVPILHIPCSTTGPCILNIFLLHVLDLSYPSQPQPMFHCQTLQLVSP